MKSKYENQHERAVRILARRDRDLAQVVRNYGPPPIWVRDPGFPTLVFIILEQQVSLASARAANERLRGSVRRLTPRTFLKLDDKALLEIGFSRQKREYCRGLSHAIITGDLRLQGLPQQDDHGVRSALLKLRGVGNWTADVYLMMALRRLDIWPVGDLALQVAVQKVKRLRKRPSPERLEKLGEQWRPWRSVAARIFWHDYLSGRKSPV